MPELDARRLRDHDLIRCADGALETGRGVHHVAECRELFALGGSEIARERPAAVDRNPHPDGIPGPTVVEAHQLTTHVEGRGYCAFRVVRLVEWCAEDGENRIADELVERAFVLEDGVGHAFEVVV